MLQQGKISCRWTSKYNNIEKYNYWLKLRHQKSRPIFVIGILRQHLTNNTKCLYEKLDVLSIQQVFGHSV